MQKVASCKDKIPLSERWKVFFGVEVPENYDGIPESLINIKGEIVKPLEVDADDGQINLADLAGYCGNGCISVLYNEFDTVKAGNMRIGASADYWMEVYLNGELIFSTIDVGNGSFKYATSDHIFDLPLKAGKNLLAVKILSGSTGWMFVCESPSDESRRLPAQNGMNPEMISGLLGNWRKRWSKFRPGFDENIEQYRKSDCVLMFVDSKGEALAGMDVKIQQKSHEFVFGCNILPLGQLGDGRDEAFEQAFAKLFNLATTTLTWCDYEPEPGKFRFADDSQEIWRRPPTDRVRDFCRKHGLSMKGQPLMTDHWIPDWVSSDPNEFKTAWRSYVEAVADRHGDDLAIMDVANELFSHKKEFQLVDMGADYVRWAFEVATQLFPKNTLLEINEGTLVNDRQNLKYYELIKDLIAKGADIQSIGCQFHFIGDLAAHLLGVELQPEVLLDSYARLSKLERPLFISEVTIPASDSEEIQSEALENFYRLWFSIPAMRGVIYWNLCDGAAWKTEGNALGGLLDADLREKPAYQKLFQLIHHEWNTSLNLKTEVDGKVKFRGFHGKYDITYAIDGKMQKFEIEVEKESENRQKLIAKWRK